MQSGNSFETGKIFFSNVLAYYYFDTTFTIGPANQQQEISGLYVSGNYFPALGVSAFLGRVLQSPDDQPGAPPVCVIGYRLWRQSYGQSPGVRGRPIRVNGNEFRVVGVAPRSFFGVDVGNMHEIFMPLEAQRTYRDYPIRWGKQTPSLDDPFKMISIAARLKPGVSVSQASAGLQVLGPEIFKVLTPRPNEGREQSVARASLVAVMRLSGSSQENSRTLAICGPNRRPAKKKPFDSALIPPIADATAAIRRSNAEAW